VLLYISIERGRGKCCYQGISEEKKRMMKQGVIVT